MKPTRYAVPSLCIVALSLACLQAPRGILPARAAQAAGIAALTTDERLVALLGKLKLRESLMRNPSGLFTETSTFSPAEIARNLEQAQGRVTTGTIPHTTRFYWATDGRRWRCDESTTAPVKYPVSAMQRAYDGKRYLTYTPEESALRFSADENNARFTTDMDYFLLSHNSEPLSQYLAGHECRMGGWETRDGLECLKLTVVDNDRRGDRENTYWFATKYGYAPVEVAYLSARKGEPKSLIATFKSSDFRKVGGELWLPMRIARVYYRTEPGQQPVAAGGAEFTVDQFTLDTPDIDTKFHFATPVGTRVYEPGQPYYVVE